MKSEPPPLQSHPDEYPPPWMHPAVFIAVILAVVALEKWIR